MTKINFPKGAERYFINHNRWEAVKVMKTLYQSGYRWIARDYESESLMLYNLKPKKYMDISSWGYRESDYNNSMMAESIKNTDITEIRWKNQQPTDLGQFIKDNEVVESEWKRTRI